MTNICPVFLYSSMTTIYHVILVSMMNICDVLLLIFFINKFLSCAFLKHIFKVNYLFHSFMYQEQILVLYFLCINDKHFSRVFSIFQRKVFISYFLCITDKYFIPWFCFSYLFVINTNLIFYLSLKNAFPIYFFYIYQWQIFVLYFFYVSMINIYPVFFYSSMKTIICPVLLYQWWIFVLCFFLNIFQYKFLSCAFSFNIFSKKFF